MSNDKHWQILADILLSKAVREGKSAEFLEKLYEGYGVTIDMQTKEFVYAKIGNPFITKLETQLAEARAEVERLKNFIADFETFSRTDGVNDPAKVIDFGLKAYDLRLNQNIHRSPTEQENADLKADRLELKNLVKWLYVQTNGLDSSFELSHDFVDRLAEYLEPLE